MKTITITIKIPVTITETQGQIILNESSKKVPFECHMYSNMLYKDVLKNVYSDIESYLNYKSAQILEPLINNYIETLENEKTT